MCLHVYVCSLVIVLLQLYEGVPWDFLYEGFVPAEFGLPGAVFEGHAVFLDVHEEPAPQYDEAVGGLVDAPALEEDLEQLDGAELLALADELLEVAAGSGPVADVFLGGLEEVEPFDPSIDDFPWELPGPGPATGFSMKFYPALLSDLVSLTSWLRFTRSSVFVSSCGNNW